MLGPAVAKSSMRKIFTWILTGSVAAVMIFAGSVKLVGTPNMVAAFKGFGYSLWLMYVWGALEIVSAALLFVHRMRLSEQPQSYASWSCSFIRIWPMPRSIKQRPRRSC